MSETKPTKKLTKEASTSDNKKTSVDTKTDTNQKPSTSKSEKKPKSASQTSISHFSSVSTPAYRSGWENIFGEKNKLKSDTPKVNQETFTKLSINNGDIDIKLREALYKEFAIKATKQGYEFPKPSNSKSVEYNLSCRIKRNK